jgi:hypothetical protein
MLMFGLRLMTIVLLLFWGFFVLIVLRLETPMAQAVRPRLLVLLGAILTIAAFFFQPWIEFGFLDYILPTPEFVKTLAAPEVVIVFVERIGMEWFSKLIYIFNIFTEFNGWQIELIPTFGWGTRLVTIFPVLLAVAAILALPVCATFRGQFLPKTLGLLLLVSCTLNAVLLLIVLPNLDALGIQGNFQWNLFATILGAHISSGPWFCMLGLMLLGLGGVIEIVDSPSGEKDNSEG